MQAAGERIISYVLIGTMDVRRLTFGIRFVLEPLTERREPTPYTRRHLGQMMSALSAPWLSTGLTSEKDSLDGIFHTF